MRKDREGTGFFFSLRVIKGLKMLPVIFEAEAGQQQLLRLERMESPSDFIPSTCEHNQITNELKGQSC